MANETVLIESAGENAVNRTVADANAITKGTLLKLADPNTASAATGSGEAFGGIAVADKVADDGSITLGASMSGSYDILSSTVAITAGAAVVMSGANAVRAAVAGDLLTGALVGYAEETSSANEVIRIRLRGN